MAKNKTQNGLITINGELTIYAVAKLKLLAKLLTNDKSALDLSAVEEFDGAGLQLLVVMKRGAVSYLFRIIKHSLAIFNFLELANLTNLLGDSRLVMSEIVGETEYQNLIQKLPERKTRSGEIFVNCGTLIPEEFENIFNFQSQCDIDVQQSIGGFTILGSDEVALIVDIPSLMNQIEHEKTVEKMTTLKVSRRCS